MFLSHPRVKVRIAGSLRDREVACSASDRQGSNFEFGVWRTVSSQSSHHPQEVLLARFSLYVHKGGLKPDSFHFTVNIHQYSETSLPSDDQQFRDFIDIICNVPTRTNICRLWNNILPNDHVLYIYILNSSHFHDPLY